MRELRALAVLASLAFAPVLAETKSPTPQLFVHLHLSGLAHSPNSGTAQVNCSFAPDAARTLRKTATFPVGPKAADTIPFRFAWDYGSDFKVSRTITCRLVSVFTDPPISTDCVEYSYNSVNIPAARRSTPKPRGNYDTKLAVKIRWPCFEKKTKS